MEKKIIEKMNNANNIVNQAFSHYNHATEIIHENIESKKGKLMLVKIGLIILGFIFACVGNTDTAIGNISSIMFFPYLIVGPFVYCCIIKPTTNEASDEANRLANNEVEEGNRIIEANIENLKFIPSDNWYPLATSFMLKALMDGKADTVKEVLNLFDEQLHRWKVEEQNDEINRQLAVQGEQLNSIKRNSGVAAAASTANVFFTIASKM